MKIKYLKDKALDIVIAVILLFVLIVLMIIQTALFVVDGLLSRSKNRETLMLQQQISTFQEQVKMAQQQYYNDVQTLRKSNCNLSDELSRRIAELRQRDSIIHHQDLLIKAYKLKLKRE